MNKITNTDHGVPGEKDDLLAVAKIAWKRRWFIIKIIIVFFAVGCFIAVVSPNQFKASSTFVPQSQNSGKSGQLTGLASLAGINLNEMGNLSEIPPSLYPKIINSIRFKRALLDVPITIEVDNRKTTYEEFYEKFHTPDLLSTIRKYTVGLPGVISGSFSDYKNLAPGTETQSNLIRLTQGEVQHFRRLEHQLEVIPNDKEGTVQLNFIMPEALMAAEMAQAAEELLQKEVIAYKIRNAGEQLKFTQEQFEEKKITFLQKQKELANFRDKNQHISSALALNKLHSLEAEYNFAFSIYTEMAKQLEQSRLQVSKDTPVFSVINPVSVPVDRTAPKRIAIMIAFISLGTITGLGVVFFMKFFDEVKRRWKNQA